MHKLELCNSRGVDVCNVLILVHCMYVAVQYQCSVSVYVAVFLSVYWVHLLVKLSAVLWCESKACIVTSNVLTNVD